jgi:Rrf2 family protein
MISKKTINAIELCVLLAGQRGEGYLTTTELSPRLNLSVSYLENILKPLKEQGLVLSMKGPGGGYMIKGDVSLISIWDVARVFETSLFDVEDGSEVKTQAAYELELEQVVINNLKSFMLSDFADFSSSELKSYSDVIGRFKFKPLPMPFMPKAPNSVFQLAMSL